MFESNFQHAVQTIDERIRDSQSRNAIAGRGVKRVFRLGDKRETARDAGRR
jgi:hypothetical protein